MSNARTLDSRNPSESAPAPVQRVTPTERQKRLVAESHRDLMAGYPFLASLASSDSVFYHAVLTDRFPVAATDNVAIYLNTAPGGWLDEKAFTADERVFIHAHEIAHIMREDPMWGAVYQLQGSIAVPRTPGCPEGRLPYENDIAQKACDAIINAGLIKDGVGKMPKGGFLHPAIAPEMTTGEAYAILWQQKQDGQGNGQGPGQPGQGGQQPDRDPMRGDQQAPGSMGDPEGDESEDSSQPQNPAEALQRAKEGAAERAVAVQRATNAARQAGHGSSCMEQMIQAAREPGIDWRSYMQGFLARAAGNSAYNFARPARPPLLRDLMGQEPYFTPSRVGHGCDVLWWVGDVSGSIGEAEHRATLSAATEMMRELNPRLLCVAWVDTKVLRIDTFNGTPGADALEDFYNRKPIPRGGGTSFIPPFEMVESLANGGMAHVPADADSNTICDVMEAGKPDGLIYFTDLYGPSPDHAPNYPVLWVATTDARHPWGERVTIDPQTLV